MSTDVFISHSSKDASIAVRICEELERNGIECWIAPRDVTPGKKYAACIVEAIRASQAMLVIFSDHTNASNPVVSELECAMKNEVDVIPLRVGNPRPNDEMEYYLSSRHWLEWMDHDVDAVMGRLVTSIRKRKKQHCRERDEIIVEPVPAARKSGSAPQNRVELSCGGCPDDGIPAPSDFGEAYMEIDKQYAELLKAGLQDPDLRDRATTSGYAQLDSRDPFRKKYHVYANLCWNLIETIYDSQLDEMGRYVPNQTWEPVLLEENRLHLSWFRRNTHLFKEGFKNFVLQELNGLELLWGNEWDLDKIMPRYDEAFPIEERKTKEQLRVLIENGRYRLFMAWQKALKKTVGFAFIYEDPVVGFLWIDYIAMDERYRSNGWGTTMIQALFEKVGKKFRGAFVELEIPDHRDTMIRENQERRIRFYERLGAVPVDRRYHFPSNDGPYPMQLHYIPIQSRTAPSAEYVDLAIRSVFLTIHQDAPAVEDIMTMNLSPAAEGS